MIILIIVLIVVILLFSYYPSKEDDNLLKNTGYDFLWLYDINDLNREKYNSEEKIKLLKEELEITKKSYLLIEIAEEEKYLSYVIDTLNYKRSKR